MIKSFLATATAASLATSLALLGATPALADGYLQAKDARIVDETGAPVILRGMGLGGWMLQEGYMLKLGELGQAYGGKGQEYVIRAETAKLVGAEREAAIHQAWLDNHTTKADIDAMAAMGFNSVRLPMHYGLLTLAADQEPVPGQDTWKEDGFKRIDDLLAWTKANGMYLILDLHAAPGGQGNDLPIADRDPSKPSLWQSPENRRKVVALWRKLAQRYKDEPAVGAYDLLNEPNWDFDGPGGDHGCKDEKQAALWDFYKDLTAAVREIDKRHMIVLEGNCWGNNYKGMPAAWDGNMALSFHKYWNLNDQASIASVLKLREDTGLPLWLGESGENSNAWFRDSIALVEKHEIGWAYWPLKKIGFNQPLEVTPNAGYLKLVDYWIKNGPKPTADEAYGALMQLASKDNRFENNIAHADVVDAMIRQPHDDTARPFKVHRIGAEGGTIAAVDYDLGRPGVAYADKDVANYHVSTGGQRTPWNNGRTYRNDGVDIAREADGSAYVEDFTDGEWLKYTVVADKAGKYDLTVSARGEGGKLSVAVNGGAPGAVVATPNGTVWGKARLAGLALMAGRNVVVLRSNGAATQVRSLALEAR